jgi:ABC-type nickel/cobalt efflux system permease component RcnA
VCIAVLLRHAWPIKGKEQLVAVGLLAAAAIGWAVILLIFSSIASQGRQWRSRISLQWLTSAATVLLAIVALILAFVAAP